MDEHVPVKEGKAWGILNLLSVASQAQKIAAETENCFRGTRFLRPLVLRNEESF